MTNKKLRYGQKLKRNNLYTQYSDIEQELKYYKEYFAGKTVLCNCNDVPGCSAFWEYFHKNFSELKLKRLVSISFNESGRGFLFEYMGKHDSNILFYTSKPFSGNGDFRSDECIKVLKEADIVVTNPPFSLFRQYITQLISFDKKFIVWGNNNAITYKEIFPLLKEGKLGLGYTVNRTHIFMLEDTEEEWDNTLSEKMGTGKKYCKVPACTVFTNLEIKKYKPLLPSRQKSSKADYPAFDNLPEVINVSRVLDIPKDYNGYMAVPITVLRYNLKDFSIVDLINRYTVFDTWKTNSIVQAKKSHSSNVKGKATYARIVLKKKSM